MKRRTLLIALPTALSGMAMFWPASGQSDEGHKATVIIEEYEFNPKELTVKPGTTVTWVNRDSVEHTATADDESFDTDLLAYGESGSITFSESGRHLYHCDPHPFMKGTVVVE